MPARCCPRRLAIRARPAAWAAAFLAVARLLGAEPAPAPPPAGVSQVKVDAAIEKGAKFLLGSAAKGYPDVNPRFAESEIMTYDEIVLLTLVHAGVAEDNPGLQAVLKRVLAAPLKRTYSVALRACALEALDRERYRFHIAQCAMFLVDNQCKNGQWYYGQPVELPPLPTLTPSEAKRPVVKSGGAGAEGGSSGAGTSPREGSTSTRALPRVLIPRRGWGPDTGDNSNTQYAILGLRACEKAGCAIPKEVFALAEKWATDTQRKEGGWGYDEQGVVGKDCTGSMSAGIGGSLAALLLSQRKARDAKEALKDKRVAEAVRWLGERFDPKQNPGLGRRWHYYFLYAVERAGSFLDTETFGPHVWYPEGAEWLLANQRPDGSWAGDTDRPAQQRAQAISDTCFAILFLRRATRKLQYTE